jgi:hypothetical protein
MSRTLQKWTPWLCIVMGTFLVSQVAWGLLAGSPEGREFSILAPLISRYPRTVEPILLVAGLIVALGFALMFVRLVSPRKEVPR